MFNVRTLLTSICNTLCAALILVSCKTTNEGPFEYDFGSKTLRDSNKKVISRPLEFPASNDLQITVVNFNPIKYELSIRDSFTTRFLDDSSKLASMVIIPKTPELAAPNKGTGVAANPECDPMADYVRQFNKLSDDVESSMENYKVFLSKTETLKDIHDFLRRKEALNPTEVRAKLADNFIAALNDILAARNKLNENPEQVSSRQIGLLEDYYYQVVVEQEENLSQLQKKIDEIKESCSGFADWYKNLVAPAMSLKERLKEFRQTHTEKIIPSFSKTIILYDELTQYLTSVPPFITPAVPIQKDDHTILIYKRELGSERTLLHDQISVEPDQGWKLDISAGVFFSGIHDNSYTKKSKDSIYTKKSLVDGTITDTTVQETFTALYKRDQFPVSFGGMLYLHAHTQNAQWANFGVYLGFGALFNDQTRWAGSIGGSLLIGKKQRFNINPGLLISQVDRLSPPYETETWYRETIDNIPISRDWKMSWVFGFSWNLK